MTNTGERSNRWLVAILKLLLLGGSIAMMWWHPLGDSVSVVVGSALGVVFLSLLPVLFKGANAAKSESDLVKREFSGGDERDRFRKR